MSKDMARAPVSECRLLREDECDGLGNPKDAITIECVEHTDLLGKGWRFWVARCPTLPGYDGEGVTPAAALGALQSEFSSGTIYRVNPPKNERLAIARWRETGRSARAATALLQGRTRSSVAIGSAAKEFTVRASEVAKLNNAIFDVTANRVGRPFTEQEEAEMRAWLANTINCPGNAAWAEAINDSEPHHRLLKRWAREKFPQP